MERTVVDTLTYRTARITGPLCWLAGMLVARVTYASGNHGFVRTDMLRYI